MSGPVEGKGRGRVNAPWSDKGWYAQEQRRGRDPVLKQLIEEQARGRRSPVIRFDRPGAAIGAASANPYINACLGIGMAVFSSFIFDKLQGTPWAAWVVGGFFLAGGVMVILMESTRAPAWHRARKVAKAYVAEHGGRLPPEVRILG